MQCIPHIAFVCQAGGDFVRKLNQRAKAVGQEPENFKLHVGFKFIAAKKGLVSEFY